MEVKGMTTITNAKDFNNYIQTVMSRDSLAVKLDGRIILMLMVDQLCHLRTYAEDIKLNGMVVTLYNASGYLGTFICNSIDVHLESEDLNVE